MALQLVGQTSGQGTGATYDISLNGTLTGGIASSPSAGDIVVVISGFGATASSAPTITGDNNGSYPTVHANIYSNDTWDTNYQAFYDIQGSTVDTKVTAARTNSTLFGGVTIVQVWRGVDSTTPLDVTAATASGGNASRPDPPIITPTTAGAVIIAGGIGTQGTLSTSAFTAPSNMTTGLSILSTGGTTSQVGVFLSYLTTWTSGSFDPNAATGGSTSNSSAWSASTFVLRPAPGAVTHATTGTLTGQIGSVVGSATHVAKHGTTGTLTGQLGSVVGSATRFRTYSTSGTLTGQSSSIVGSARLNIPHSTSGVLTGQLGSLSGSARRYRTYSTSGSLTGQIGSITGDADREPKALPHTSTGVLTGQGSVVIGDADRESQIIPHVASGSLVGQGAIVVGSAQRTGSAQEVDGGSNRRQRKSRLIVVEVDGKEYRITEAQLPSFLEQVRVEAEQQAKTQEKPVKRSRKGKKAKVEPTPVEEAPVIVVKQAPPDIVPKINAQIEQTNTVIANAFAISMQKYLQELEDEEIILMLM